MITAKPGYVTDVSAWRRTVVLVPVSRVNVMSVREQFGSMAAGCLSAVIVGIKSVKTTRWNTRLHAKFWRVRITNVEVVTRWVSIHVSVVNFVIVTITSAGKAPSWRETSL